MRLHLALLLAAGCAAPAGPPAERQPPPSPPVPTASTDPTVSGWTGVPPDPTFPSTGNAPYVMDGFSFVDAWVAGMPQPGSLVPLAQDLDFLVSQEIVLLVSLTVEPTDPFAVGVAGLEQMHIPIVDFTPPTLTQQEDFVAETTARVAAEERVGVHDTAGLGRCGTMLATWFVAQGMTAEEAMAAIRKLRPGSIETVEQEQAVIDYAASLLR